MPSSRAVDPEKTAVLFDFDGTLGDTETPAMRVAFWELAPYLPDATPESLTLATRDAYVRDNAGKAFEFMVDIVEEDRAKAGLPSIEAVRSSASEDPTILAVVDAARAESGLPPLADTRALGKDILTLQKDETVDALSVLAKPCDNVPSVLATLTEKRVPFSIATTSGKPRVPVSVVSCGFTDYFPPEAIHSGESDFDPPRFKPDPSVYELAAEKTGVATANAVAVEDSTSGVGSAANAKIGMIVGYVGGSHIAEGSKDDHAATLMAGGRSEDGRGADIVVSDMLDLVPLVDYFAMLPCPKPAPMRFPKVLVENLASKTYVDQGRVFDGE